jgi:hypothetical protein
VSPSMFSCLSLLLWMISYVNIMSRRSTVFDLEVFV